MIIWTFLCIIVAVVAIIVFRDDTSAQIAVAMLGILVWVLGFLCAVAALDMRADARCKELGWREGSYNLVNQESYCITRSDQTDIIKPLSYAESNPR